MESTAGNDCDWISIDLTRYLVEGHLLAFLRQSFDLNDPVFHVVFEFLEDAERCCLVFDIGIVLFRKDDDLAERTRSIRSDM